MKGRNSSKFTREEKLQIIQDYETGDLSMREINEKYGIQCKSLISMWRIRLQKDHSSLQNSEKSSTFIVSSNSQMKDEEDMKQKTPAELEAEVKRLTKELEWAKLQNKAFNIMIDIAESHGINIRKKNLGPNSRRTS